MDVVAAFLHSPLEEEIYIEQPEGYVDPDHPDWVCHLLKSLHGLKQGYTHFEIPDERPRYILMCANIIEALSLFNMTNCWPIATPMILNLKTTTTTTSV
jgi:hypothetical protein